MKPELLVTCDCNSEILRLEKLDGMLILTLFSSGNSYSLWRIIKGIWEIIKTGHIPNNEIVIYRDDLIKLQNFIAEGIGND